MLKKLFAGAITLITLTAAATGIAGEDELQREIREFHIAFVADGSVGRWRDAGEEGAIKYLIYSGGYEEVYRTLFIQWFQDDATQPNKQSLIATRAVNLVQGVFGVPTLVYKNPYTLHVVVDTIYCDEPQSYNVEIRNKGTYKIDYLNKERCEDADTSGTYSN